ncbi:glycoside hydrolase family 16 protein [Nakamurella deserti]|uniref:glycoside hydrolase family 16 protein n=1 Tax=Nakamurella deserti TaxID=2164074 RepID=UPI000DBE55B1|nr:glycoside hydrolase family 16 protein [Nakamurella deserti]
MTPVPDRLTDETADETAVENAAPHRSHGTSPSASDGEWTFVDDFDGPTLDDRVWSPHYLPAWSSRAESAATYRLRDSCLELLLPPGTGAFLPGRHHPALRVSGIQSGNFSGPVGGTHGQQPPLPGTRVRERQPLFRGWTPTGGRLEMRARFDLSPRSMAAWWLVGVEEDPQECAEICVAEIFGDAVIPGRSAAVGMGLHAFRDPRVTENFAAPRLDIDVAAFHDYAVDWTPHEVVFAVDDVVVRRCPAPPWYPMQSMLAVFDFPERSRGDDDDHTPALVVDRVRGRAPADGTVRTP